MSLEVELWCQNYHSDVDRNGGLSHFWSRKSKVLIFRLQGDLATMVINVPSWPDLRGNKCSSPKSITRGVDGDGGS